MGHILHDEQYHFLLLLYKSDPSRPYYSQNGEKTFVSGEFSNWKKCQEKLKKHSQSKFHAEATEKVLLFNETRSDIGAKLVSGLQEAQKTQRQMLLKQISTIRYLARQAQGLHGKTQIESNLHQLLKLRAEDVPELLEWIDNGKYLSHTDEVSRIFFLA